MELISGLMTWGQEKLRPLGSWGLFLLAFSEASFNPIPVETLYIPLCLANPELTFFFTFVAIAGSVIGGCFGYLIGYIGERAVLERFFDHKKIDQVHQKFEKHGAMFVLLASFTPLPYKLATISAGVFYIDFKKFVLASLIGRGARFLTVGTLIFLFGAKIIEFLDTHFIYVTLISGVLMVAGYIIYLRYKSKKRTGKTKRRKTSFETFK